MIRPGDGTSPGIDQVNLGPAPPRSLPTLGVWHEQAHSGYRAHQSANGSKILIAGSDGSVMIYDAVAGTFTVSRQDFKSLGGSYAASSFNQYVVGNNLLDSSGVPSAVLPISTGTPSGFAFVDTAQSAYFTTAPNSSSPGVISQVNLANGSMIQPTAMVEAPILGATSSSGSTGGTGAQTTTCAGAASASCTAPLFTPSVNTVWTRSLAPLPSGTAIISLSTSGLTVLPWTYAAAVAAPQVAAVVSAADGESPAAPGGLISFYGSQLSPTNLATTGTSGADRARQ